MIDGGTLSPKVTIPTSVLVLAGAVLGVLDATGILDLDDSLWIALLGAGGVSRASPGTPRSPGAVVRDERGYSLVELLAALFIAVLLLLVLLAVLDRL
jgi:hypothetical protein